MHQEISIQRCISDLPEFLHLVTELDKELAIRDGDEHSFYAQYNTLKDIQHVVVAFHGKLAIGCGAIKVFDAETMEVKRMFVSPEVRNQGVAGQILAELEKWCREMGVCRCVLETGMQQPEAIRLYRKSGYVEIPNYGQYAGVENSVCFEKRL